MTRKLIWQCPGQPTISAEMSVSTKMNFVHEFNPTFLLKSYEITEYVSLELCSC